MHILLGSIDNCYERDINERTFLIQKSFDENLTDYLTFVIEILKRGIQ